MKTELMKARLRAQLAGHHKSSRVPARGKASAAIYAFHGTRGTEMSMNESILISMELKAGQQASPQGSRRELPEGQLAIAAARQFRESKAGLRACRRQGAEGSPQGSVRSRARLIALASPKGRQSRLLLAKACDRKLPANGLFFNNFRLKQG